MKYRIIAMGTMLLAGLVMAPHGWAKEKSPHIATQASSQNTDRGVIIDGINYDDKSVVIGDVVYQIAPDARFIGKDGYTQIPLSRFKKGDLLRGFSVGPNGVIKEMRHGAESK
jgi:hypothetical protein